MSLNPARCLILACGNTLRGDDGVGPWLAQWAENRFRADDSVCVIARQQWTPELAQEVAQAESVLFIDCSIESTPGLIRLVPVSPSSAQGLATHRVGAEELLALADKLFHSQPGAALQLTVGAGTIALGEEFSSVVNDALPRACQLLEATVRTFLLDPADKECAAAIH
jgi:hydrogenase maturation protease